MFPDQEDSNWEYDRKAKRWYLHRFYSHQPDLNVANPAVRDEIAQVVGYWLEQGLAGFRVDAVPFLIEPTGMPEGAIQDPHELLRDLRRFIGRRRGEAILMGEVNLPPGEQREFFGDEDGDELHMVLTSPSTRRCTWRSRAARPSRWRARCARCRRSRHDCQWANFVRNHDELTLDKLTEAEREEVFAAFGPEPRAPALRARPAAAAAVDGRTATRTASGSPTRSPSRCPARRCCSTARRSGWGRTSRSRAA